MGAGRGKQRRTSASQLRPKAAAILKRELVPTPAQASQIIETIDRLTGVHLGNSWGVTVAEISEAISSDKTNKMSKRDVASALAWMDKNSELVGQTSSSEALKVNRKIARWQLRLKTPSEDSVYDFGAGTVPAKRHVNGGGWVADSASVAPSAYVGPGAAVLENAVISDQAIISGHATVSGNAEISARAKISDKATADGYASVRGYAKVSGNARVCEDAIVADHAEVWGNAVIAGNAQIVGEKKVGTGTLWGEMPPITSAPERAPVRVADDDLQPLLF